MLLTLLGNLVMIDGSQVPNVPIPILDNESCGELINTHEREQRRKRLLEDDETVFEIIKMFLKVNNI